MVLSEEEFQEWKQSPVTKEFFKLLRKQREEFKEQLILDLYENGEWVKGKASALLELIEMKYEDLQEGLHGKQ
jgi:hypothetical protein